MTASMGGAVANPPAVPPVRALPHVKDRTFLPAALEIVETPPSPAAVVLMLAICAFAVGALAWCWFGRLDVYATARGKIEPLVGAGVYLDLWVKVLPNWRRNAQALQRFGYQLPEDRSS